MKFYLPIFFNHQQLHFRNFLIKLGFQQLVNIQKFSSIQFSPYMTQPSLKDHEEQPFNDSDSSSYLSQCSSDDNDDYEMALALKQKCTLLQENFVMKKSIVQDFSTSEFSFQTEANSHSLQKNKNFNESNQSNAKSAHSDPSNDNIRLKNKANLLQDTLDLNQMLKILNECQKDDQKTKMSNKNNQNFMKVNNSPQRFHKFQPYPKEISNKLNQNEYFHDTTRKVPLYREQKVLYERRIPKLPHKFNQPIYPSQNSSIKPPYQTLNKSRQIFAKRSEQFASQNYLFWGVLISIKLASFMGISKNVLIVPFSNAQFSDPFSKIIQSKIKYNLKEIALKQSIKCKEKQVPNGNVFSVKAKGLQSNYRGLYFIKSPQNTKQSLKYYDVSLLKKGIEKIFGLLDSHNQEHVVFPEFNWGCFSQGEVCEVLISGIFREINEKKKSRQCQNMKEVIICVSNCETFELYSKYLRFYAKQMIG